MKKLLQIMRLVLLRVAFYLIFIVIISLQIMSPINGIEMDSSDKDNWRQKDSCTLCSIFGQFVVSDIPESEDPIERLAKTADAILLPWRQEEEPLECKDLSHETWLELLRKMNKLIETEWNTKHGDFIFNEKGDKDDNMNKATVAENVVSDTIKYAVLDYPVVCSYFCWNRYEEDILDLVLFRYICTLLGRPKSSN